MLGAVTEAASDAMIVVDLDGRVLRWNRGAERLFGWEEADVCGEYLPYVPESSRLKALSDLRRLAGERVPVRTRIVTESRDGRSFTPEGTAIPVPDAEGHTSSVLVVVHQSPEYPAGSVELTDNLGFALARATKGALTALTGYAQLLTREEILADPGKRARTAAALDDRVRAVSDVIDTALIISELESRTTSSHGEPVDVPSFVADVVALFEEESSSRVTLDYDSAAGQVLAEPRLLSRALKALLMASSQEQLAALEVSVVREDKNIAIVVRTLKESTSRAAAPNWQNGVLSQDSDGIDATTVLELRLARRIIEVHGGTIDVSKSPDDVRYRVRLPAGAN